MINIEIWKNKYKHENEQTPLDTFKRVASAIASVEKNPKPVEQIFLEEMKSLRFVPGGRILAYAGTKNKKATLANCYVMKKVPDNMEGIMQSLHEAALTMKAGGGIGINFSNLRPEGSPVKGTNSVASGPVSFMEMWNAMSRTISGVNKRKGAMIAVLNINHPDIEKFVLAKRNNSPENPILEKFNISVGITDTFMQAVINNKEWPLVFDNKVYKTVKARDLMKKIVENAWQKAEPGIIFIDNLNNMNNLYYAEHIDATNPCGEIPLPEYGACMLGAINLPMFVINPFEDHARIDYTTLGNTIKTAVRFLDNTIDVCYFPLEEQRKEAQNKRRIGLGIMGLGSTMAMLKIKYGSQKSVEFVNKLMSFLRNNAYLASCELAKERGSFPLFEPNKYIKSKFIKKMPKDIIKRIGQGIRNSHVLTIAPTGSIAQLAGNVSSGVEPIFNIEYTRKNPEYNQVITVQDYAWQVYTMKNPNTTVNNKPEFFVTAHELTWQDHIKIMSACQQYVDNSISKTINLPQNTTVEDLNNVFIEAWKKGLKGCTIYREGSLDEILSTKTKKETKQQLDLKNTITKKDRPYFLPGGTYKIKLPEAKHAYYLSFTYNPETKKPVELFVNTKDPTVGEWTIAFGRMISAIFRNTEDPTFIVEDLKEVMGKSGFFSSRRRKFVPSLTAEFGEVINDFLTHIGAIEPEIPIEAYVDEENNLLSCSNNKMAYCPLCGKYAAVFEEGCFKCLSCGYNKCG